MTDIHKEIKEALELAIPGPWLVSLGNCIDEPTPVYRQVDEMNTDIIAGNLLAWKPHLIANTRTWLFTNRS